MRNFVSSGTNHDDQTSHTTQQLHSFTHSHFTSSLSVSPSTRCSPRKHSWCWKKEADMRPQTFKSLKCWKKNHSEFLGVWKGVRSTRNESPVRSQKLLQLLTRVKRWNPKELKKYGWKSSKMVESAKGLDDHHQRKRSWSWSALTGFLVGSPVVPTLWTSVLCPHTGPENTEPTFNEWSRHTNKIRPHQIIGVSVKAWRESIFFISDFNVVQSVFLDHTLALVQVFQWPPFKNTDGDQLDLRVGLFWHGTKPVSRDKEHVVSIFKYASRRSSPRLRPEASSVPPLLPALIFSKSIKQMTIAVPFFNITASPGDWGPIKQIIPMCHCSTQMNGGGGFRIWIRAVALRTSW